MRVGGTLENGGDGSEGAEGGEGVQGTVGYSLGDMPSS